MSSIPDTLFRQRLFLHSFATIVHVENKAVRARLTMAQFESMPHIVVSLTGRRTEAYDDVLVRHGIQRNVMLTTPHFLAVPLLMERNPELIATVPLELANTFGRFGFVRAVEPPVSVPPYSISQHWHPRFHHDPAIVWLRERVKTTFEDYPQVHWPDRGDGSAPAGRRRRDERTSDADVRARPATGRAPR